MRRHRGLLVALLVSAATLTAQYLLHRDEIDRYDRHVLPAFDAYVYTAMADNPAFFTLPPWGYRILVPWLVHALPVETPAAGFRGITFAALFLAGGALYLYLRRLGSAPLACVLAVLAFGLTEPVAESASYVFLTDPVVVLFEILLLLALEAGAGLGVLLLLAVAGTLAKEVFLLLLPAIYFVRRDRDGDRRAAVQAAAAIAAALATMEVLRSWAPQLSSELPLVGADVVWLALYRILAGWRDWWQSVLLGGLLPLAALGACRVAARPYLKRNVYLILLTLVLPFAVSVRNDDTRQVPFMAQDIPRVLLLALPVLLPLALVAVDRVRPHLAEPPPPLRVPAWADRAAGVAGLVLLALPLAVVDRYRRVDLRGPHDGRLVLALTRESLAFAQRLERGKPVAYAPEARRFSPGKSDPHLLERMRWFLRDGWGPMPHYAMGNVVMQAKQASLLLPCFQPADWELLVTLSAPRETHLGVEANGRKLGEVAVGLEPERYRLEVPAAALVRGDNLLTLVAEGDAPEARLHELVVRPISR